MIVPTHQGRHHLEQLLPSLHEQTLPHEVIVVDNGSTDGTHDLLQERWPQVRVISFPDNRGFGKAVNAGVAAATSQTVVLLNNDTICTPTFLERLVAALTLGKESSWRHRFSCVAAPRTGSTRPASSSTGPSTGSITSTASRWRF